MTFVDDEGRYPLSEAAQYILLISNGSVGCAVSPSGQRPSSHT